MDENQNNGLERKLDKSNDTLHFIYLITLGVNKYWIFRCFMIWTFIFHASVSFVEIFDILSTFNGFVLVKYGPSLFLMMNGLCVIVMAFLLGGKCEELLNKIFDSMKFLDFVRPKIWRKIVIESKIITAAAAIDLILGIGICIMVTFNYEQNREFYYALHIFETRMSSQLNLLFSFLYYPLIYAVLFASIAISLSVSYILIHQKFQVYVLNDFLRNIASDYKEIADSILIQDQEYQDTIHLRLIRFVYFHQLLKNSVNKFNELIYVHINIMLSSAMASYISIMYYALVMGDQEVSKYQLWAIILLILCSGVTIGLFFYSGQSLQDEHSKIKENAWACPWTVWNAKNRRSLIIILENCNKRVLVGTEGFFVCEYEYGLKMINFMISTSMFFQTMTNLHANS